MKFGKLLKNACEGMPDSIPHDLFLRYKELKKHLKAMKKAQKAEAARLYNGTHSSSGGGTCDAIPGAAPPSCVAGSSAAAAEAAEGPLSPEEAAFVATLNEDLSKFNSFFIENEEVSVIRLQVLSDELAAAASMPADERALSGLKARLIDFHGDLVLLLHWSLLNYAAVVKILKKHDKRTGLLLRAPYLANVLHQPFYSTTIMSRLVKSAEQHINALAELQQAQGGERAGGSAVEDGAFINAPEQHASTAGDSSCVSDGDRLSAGILRGTRVALDTWSSLLSNATTPSTLLPPSTGTLVEQLQAQVRWARQPAPGAAAAAAQRSCAGSDSDGGDADVEQQGQDQRSPLGAGDSSAVARKRQRT